MPVTKTSFKPGQSGNPEGSKPRGIDINEVEALAQVHATYVDMAAHFGVHRNTIIKRVNDTETFYTLADGSSLTFREVIDRGNARGRVSLRQAQFKMAIAGNATMQIWLGKQLLEQTDEHKITHAGKIESGSNARESIIAKLDSISRRTNAEEIAGHANADGAPRT